MKLFAFVNTVNQPACFDIKFSLVMVHFPVHLIARLIFVQEKKHHRVYFTVYLQEVRKCTVSYMGY